MRKSSFVGAVISIVWGVLPTGSVGEAQDSTKLGRLPEKALCRLGAPKRFHGISVEGIAFALEGKALVTSGGGEVVCWEYPGMAERRRWKGKGRAAVTPDGKQVAFVLENSDISVFDLETGKEAGRIEAQGDRPSILVYAPDGKRLAAGGENGSIRLWEWPSGRLQERVLLHEGPVLDVAISPDGHYLASSGIKPGIILRELTGESAVLLAKGNGPDPVAFSPDGKFLAVGYANISLYDIGTRKKAGSIHPMRERTVYSLAFSPDGKSVASGGGPFIPIVVSDIEGKDYFKLRGHEGAVTTVAFSLDGKRLVSGGEDGFIQVWDIETRKEALREHSHTGTVSSIAYSHDGRSILTGGADGMILVWDGNTGRMELGLEAGGRTIETMDFSPDGRMVAAGGKDQVVRIWDARDGRLLHRLVGEEEICCVRFSPDGRSLASGNLGGWIRLWDAASGQEKRAINLGDADIKQLIFFPGGRILCPVSSRGKVWVWDSEAGTLLPAPEGTGGDIPELDGRIFAWGDMDDQIALRNLRTGDFLPVIQARDVLMPLASPDGRMIVGTSSRRGTPEFNNGQIGEIRLWEVAGGGEVLRFRHECGVETLAWSPDGERVASGGRDATVLVWDMKVEAGKEDLETLWEMLGGEDGGKAYRAVRTLAGRAEAVAFLKKELLKGPEEKEIAGLVEGLGSDEAAARERAEEKLRAMGPAIEAPLKEALGRTGSEEVRVRIRGLLKDLANPPYRGGRAARWTRGVWALEKAGTGEAKEALEAVAAGAKGEAQRRQAEQAARRIGNRLAKKP